MIDEKLHFRILVGDKRHGPIRRLRRRQLPGIGSLERNTSRSRSTLPAPESVSGWCSNAEALS